MKDYQYRLKWDEVAFDTLEELQFHIEELAHERSAEKFDRAEAECFCASPLLPNYQETLYEFTVGCRKRGHRDEPWYEVEFWRAGKLLTDA